MKTQPAQQHPQPNPTMSTYTITRETILAARKERSKQVKAARAALLKAESETSTSWDKRRVRDEYRAAVIPSMMHLELVNGTTIRAAVNISRLADWAKLTRGALDMRVWHVEGSDVPTKITLETERQPGVRSAVTMHGWEMVKIGKGYNGTVPFTTLGNPVRLVAPAEGGEFVLSP